MSKEVQAVTANLEVFVRQDNKICMKMHDQDVWAICDYKQLNKEELLEAIQTALKLGQRFHQEKINRVNNTSTIKLLDK